LENNGLGQAKINQSTLVTAFQPNLKGLPCARSNEPTASKVKRFGSKTLIFKSKTKNYQTNPFFEISQNKRGQVPFFTYCKNWGQTPFFRLLQNPHFFKKNKILPNEPIFFQPQTPFFCQKQGNCSKIQSFHNNKFTKRTHFTISCDIAN
jgi:hypothetical protein